MHATLDEDQAATLAAKSAQDLAIAENYRRITGFVQAGTGATISQACGIANSTIANTGGA